jgi:hypothetical protein
MLGIGISVLTVENQWREAQKMRLIDGDTLWEKLDDEPWYDNADRDEIALPIVAAAPTVDAVEVVRCKDCRYFKLYKCRMGYSSHDDFCSYGERRGGGEDG